MPTKLISKILLGTLSTGLLAAPAFAGGNCASGNCTTPVQVLPSYAPQFGPMTIRNENPLGHLRSVSFQRAPNVSITRIHGLGPTASLSDAPSGFTGGCHPSSTTYCRQNAGVPVQIELNAPITAPVFQAPTAPVVVQTGGGYDASKFAPRTYGDASLVPGIAYLPTSKVVRDPAAAQQVLDSGRTRPQDVVVPGTGTAPRLGFTAQPSVAYGGVNLPGTFNPQAAYGVNLPGTFIGGQAAPQFNHGASAPAQQLRAPGLTNTQGLSLAPTRSGPSFGQPGTPVLQQSGPLAGTYGSSVALDGSYWEKVSGPTSFGSTVATQVICKRQLPRRAVNPVVSVPVPVPVAVPHVCQAVGAHAGHHANVGQYGQSVPGRWVQ